MLNKFGVNYVETRGLAASFARLLGIDETPADPDLIIARCKYGSTPEQVRSAFKDVESLLWFPQAQNNNEVSYIARINGFYRNGNGEAIKFLHSKGDRRAPWIPGPVRAITKETDKDVIIGEGFFKMAAVHQADVPMIAFSGVWVNEPVPPEDKDKLNNRVLVRELDGWRWRGRRVLLAFDRDQASNDEVRQAVIRAWILFKVAGAEVYQLEWDRQSTGIDDHLARTCGIDPVKQKAELERLNAQARPFIDCLEKGAGGDAKLVRIELHKVKMDVTDREAFAKEVASQLGVTKASLLSVNESGKRSSKDVFFEDLQPWDEEVNGNELLAEIVTLSRKHLWMPYNDSLVYALWIFFAYLVDDPFIEVSPYLGITSPDKRCAKTRALDLIERLAKRGYGASDITKSSFFRFIEKWHPTLCLDEFHKLIGNRRELLQTFLNAYSRSKKVLVTNTETFEPEQYDIWGARAIAYLDGLDDQFRDRVIEIVLERKPRSVKKAKLRETPKQETDVIRRKLLRWANDNAAQLAQVIVPQFDTDNDRAEDNWDLLFRIAGLIDPDHIDAVVQIAVAREKGVTAERESEHGIVFKATREIYLKVAQENNFDLVTADFFLSLKTLCLILNTDAEGLWQNWKFGKEYGAYERRISQIVQQYAHQKPARSRDEANTNLVPQPNLAEPARGYWLGDLRESFKRYRS